MKAKRFFKSLLSLALAVILTASVCVCGFSVAAADENTTANIFDGTIAATYTGGSDGMLSASAGITGILEGKSVARLTPQYAFDGRRQISTGFNALAEGAINYDDAQTLSIYIKNDLGAPIKWRMTDYQNPNSELGLEYHHYLLSTGTVYWMVDTAKNTAKKYSYTNPNYIYIPENFEGYIVFDLTTCEDNALAEFVSCDFDHIFFWMEGFTEETVGNAFYYGDMNITVLSADEIVYEKTPTPVLEYVGTNPVTDGALPWRNNVTVASSESEYIGQTFSFSGPLTYPAGVAKLFTADELSYSYNAIVFRFKFAPGVTSPQKFTISTSNNQNYQYGTVTGDWTTINLINNEVKTYSNTALDAISLSGEGFEGYFILNVNDTLKIKAENLGTLAYEAFLEAYAGLDIYMRFGLSKDIYFTDDVCAFELGEVSTVEDVNNFIYANSGNKDVIFDPATDSFNYQSANLTKELVETETIGNAYQFTYDSTAGGMAKVYTNYTKVNDSFKNYEAMVFEFRTTSNYVPTFVLNGDYNYIKTKYITVNTLTGAVRKSDTINNDANSLMTEGEVFEGYIIAPINDEMTTRPTGDDPYGSWADAIDVWAANSQSGFRTAFLVGETNASRFNAWQLGEISFVKDLDAFLAPYETEEDPNESVIFNPLLDTPTNTRLTHELVKTDNIGAALQYTVTDTTQTVISKLKNISVDSIQNYKAIAFSVKVADGVNFPDYSINTYNIINAKYIRVNTLNGEISYSDTAIDISSLKAEGDFEGYIIAPIDSILIGTSKKELSTFITENAGKSLPLMLRRGASPNSDRIAGWQIGKAAFISDLDAYIEKITAPTTVKGDANLDGESDVRDLVTMKKAIAGIKDIKINAFNVKLENIGKAIDGTDLTSVRKRLLGISSVTNDVGMLAWGLSDITEWDAVYGEDYGAASDIFNYGMATNIDTVKTNNENGAASWIKVTNPFKDAANPTVMDLTNLENKINGMKQSGVWDDVVGFYTEEIRGSMTDEQYKILTKYLRDTYPGTRILAILSADEVKGREATEEKTAITPANYDTYQYTTDIGYDIYFTIDPAVYDELNNTLNTNLAGLNYKKWYFPRTYVAGDIELEQNTQQFMISHLELLFELLQAEENKGGLWLYTWVSYPNDDGTDGQIGLSELVERYGYTDLVETIVNIGAEIKTMN